MPTHPQRLREPVSLPPELLPDPRLNDPATLGPPGVAAPSAPSGTPTTLSSEVVRARILDALDEQRIRTERLADLISAGRASLAPAGSFLGWTSDAQRLCAERLIELVERLDRAQHQLAEASQESSRAWRHVSTLPITPEDSPVFIEVR